MSSELTSGPTVDPDSIKTSSTSTTRNPNNEIPSGPIFPIEIISKIVTCLQHDRKYATLASMALANSTFYDLVIPKQYETITITKTNRFKLKYGHDTRIMQHPPRFLQPKGKCYDDADCPSSTETYLSLYGTKQPRKDRAVRHCLRLIFDVPMCLVPTIQSLTNRLPCQPYGGVEEIVFTHQGISYSYAEPLAVALPPFDLPAGRVRRMDQRLLKSRRVVIYTSMNRPLSYRLHGFHIDRQSSLHSGHSKIKDTPNRSLAYVTIDIHFAQGPKKSDQSVESRLAAWVIQDYEDDDDHGFRIRLFDIPSLIIREELRPKRNNDATELARVVLSQHVQQQLREDGEESRKTKAVIDRIDFMDSEDGEEEYPVLRPRPVSPCGQTYVLEPDETGIHGSMPYGGTGGREGSQRDPRRGLVMSTMSDKSEFGVVFRWDDMVQRRGSEPGPEQGFIYVRAYGKFGHDISKE
jgi:hypothetical protein